ncbi:HNH endonuclease [Deinococcus sp. Arct2-2]|uniref:HNH endonuclease n=1 Tax=Deinococcus sp. Arct2-2 TaxID=2568653 RepID=UPI0010A3C935|nr:HNH endonuclease [Deinococcus sp. Arct2-2]THF66699.1 HNH endonuclease [Deinococcus sp. Arct2-2]
MRNRKSYRKLKNKQTGRAELVHRQIAAARLGRPLWPGEVVHHLDGDSTNNSLDNLFVLPSQGFHAHMEHVLRLERRGQPHLFPEMLRGIRERQTVTLFEAILVD